MSVDLRKITLELIRSYEEEHRYVNLLLFSHKLEGLTREEKGHVTSLLYTAVEKKLKYDYLISSFAKRPIAEIDPYVRDALRLGLAQILDIDSVPDFAAVNETVKLARHGGERSFMNAILRRAANAKDDLPYPKKEKNPERFLSVYYSVPYQTVKLLSRLFGDECEALIAALVSDRGLSLTVNERVISRDALIEKLADKNASPSKYTDNGVILPASASPMSLEGFSRGEFFVQDEASRIAAAALGVLEGDRVIDVCAAPGGKSLAAAIKAGDSGEVFSFDLHESKLSLIGSNAERLGLSNITVGEMDATSPDESLFASCDRVICDVPCSGLGVLSKKPDLRYKELLGIAELPELQYRILEESAKYLKAGGVLVYSTCTLLPSENDEITDKFIADHKEFTYEAFEVGELSVGDGRITLLPHIHGTDGFYIAKLRKTND